MASLELVFELIGTPGVQFYAWRAKVPGGWLVVVTNDVRTDLGDGRVDYGHEYRSSPTFVPDPLHAWSA